MCVGDRPGLHVLLKERFALRGIFLSGDLEQFLSGVSQLFAVGGKVPMLGKARRSSQVGSASSRLRLPEMLPAKPKSRDRVPAPGPWGQVAWLGHPPLPGTLAVLWCGPRHSKALCRLV